MNGIARSLTSSTYWINGRFHAIGCMELYGLL